MHSSFVPILITVDLSTVAVSALVAGGVTALVSLVSTYFASRKKRLFAREDEERERTSIKKIEDYLQKEQEKGKDRGQRTAPNIAAVTRLPVAEVERVALRSMKIRVVRHVNDNTGLVDHLLYQYDRSNAATE
jgi:hypothetical protein